MRVLALCLALLPLPAAAQGLIAVDLTLSPRAMAELAERAEMVAVAGFYSGEPAPGATIEADDMGLIILGNEEHIVWPVPQRVMLGANLGGMPLSQVQAPMLTVNVFSARFSDEDNLLDCGLVDGLVTEMSGTVQAVHCKLIVE